MIASIPVFDVIESGIIVDKLESLRSQWILRGTTFATLGVATYLDVVNSPDPELNYYGRLSFYNNVLRQNFDQELERVKNTLSKYLNAPVRFESVVALPGFHIFEYGGICTQEVASQHFDLQHRYLRWPFEPAVDSLISFTLAVKLPRMGGGLDYWNIFEEDVARYKRMGRVMNMERVGAMKPIQRFEYKVGALAIQLKPVMHRIGAIPEQFPGDQRITLQGHGLKDKDEWVLYW